MIYGLVKSYNLLVYVAPSFLEAPPLSDSKYYTCTNLDRKKVWVMLPYQLQGLCSYSNIFLYIFIQTTNITERF